MMPGVSCEPHGLYVHIPFCTVKCRFCNFAVYPGLRNDADLYLEALGQEIETHRNKLLDTFFIGGGTPSLLEPKQLQFLITTIRQSFQLTENYEATIECGPESITRSKLEILYQSGMTRLSFGLQASQDSILKNIGRSHNFSTFRKAYQTAQRVGWTNLNVDLMYGLPGQSLSDWKKTLRDILDLSPSHISAYALETEENTAFSCMGIEADQDLQIDMFRLLADQLGDAGYHHYEISNFSRPGFESRHNQKYWRNRPCIGVGVSSASYENGRRSMNTKSVPDYIRRMNEGRTGTVDTVVLEEPEKIGEDLMLALRLKEGAPIPPAAWNFYGRTLNKYQTLGFLEFSNDETRVRMTREGWLISNQIFLDLLSPSGAS